MDNGPLNLAPTRSLHEIYLAEKEKKKKSQKTHSIFISISSTVQMASPAPGNSVFLQPKPSSASHLSSYLRKLLSCLHTQGNNCTLTSLRPHTCCCHGNGCDAPRMTAARPGTGRDHGPAPRGGAAGEPPLAKLLNETPTSNSKTLPDGGGKRETIGDHLTFILVAMQLLTCHY